MKMSLLLFSIFFISALKARSPLLLGRSISPAESVVLGSESCVDQYERESWGLNQLNHCLIMMADEELRDGPFQDLSVREAAVQEHTKVDLSFLFEFGTKIPFITQGPRSPKGTFVYDDLISPRLGMDLFVTFHNRSALNFKTGLESSLSSVNKGFDYHINHGLSLTYRFSIRDNVLGINAYYDNGTFEDGKIQTYGHHTASAGLDYSTGDDYVAINYYYPVTSWLQKRPLRDDTSYYETPSGGFDVHYERNLDGLFSFYTEMGFFFLKNDFTALSNPLSPEDLANKVQLNVGIQLSDPCSLSRFKMGIDNDFHNINLENSNRGASGVFSIRLEGESGHYGAQL